MTDPDPARLDTLAALIAGAPLNLVATGERANVRSQHIAESLAIGELMAEAVTPGSRWIDLGTGGGLPGLVLALQFPGNHWVLIDAAEKKASVVRAFVTALGVTNATVLVGRAEALAHEPTQRAQAAGVVARAVAPLRTLVELARGFVGDAGWLVAVKGPQAEAELEAAETALARCAWRDPEVRDVPSAPRSTRLVTMRAEGPPPANIPRRTGVPHRRPF